MRTAVIRKVIYADNGSRGPDTAYVVDLIEDQKLVESRALPGKSLYYAEDVAENWENGIIKIDGSNE